jgi:BASS family bile acid:Na+ symporter
VVVALAAIVIVPASVELLGVAFGRAVHVSFSVVAMVIAQTVLAPLAAGLVVARFAGAVAERIAKPIARFAPIVLLLALLPILFKSAPAMLSLVGNGTLLAIAAFILIGIVAGHLLGGPEPANRTVLAIASSSRHPGVAVAILGANFDNAKPATAAILLYLLVNAVVTIPYQAWRKHAYGDPAPA